MNSCPPISVYGEESDVNVILAAGRLAGLKITDGRTQPNVASTDNDKNKDTPNNSSKGKKQEPKEEVVDYENGEQELSIETRSTPRGRALKLKTEEGCIRGKFAAMRCVVSVFCGLGLGLVCLFRRKDNQSETVKGCIRGEYSHYAHH